MADDEEALSNSEYSPSYNGEEDEEEEEEDSYFSDSEQSEVLQYWEGLQSGVMSHPARLQLQCLLYIIGHLLFKPDRLVNTGVMDQDETPSPSYTYDNGQRVFYVSQNGSHNLPQSLPISSLGLLPKFMRIKLLLLLPATDVAQLEGTPVTDGIPMDEIWEAIFRERLPLHKRKQMGCIYSKDIMTPNDLHDKGAESVSWKDAYFNTVFFFACSHFWDNISFSDNECKCACNHFLPDLFYGMGTFYDDPANTEIYQCFGEKLSFNIHDVCRCAHKCPRLTPERYRSMYPSLGLLFSICMSFMDVIKNLADFNVALKCLKFSSGISGSVFKMLSCLEDVAFFDNFSKLLKSVEVLEMISVEEVVRGSIKKILNVIFAGPRCSVKSLFVCESDFDIVLPLLINSSHSSLKQLELIFEIKKKSVSYLTTPLSSSIQHHHPPQPITISESLSLEIIKVLQLQQDLEKFGFYVEYMDNSYQLEDNDLIHFTSELLFRPLFKELEFEVVQHKKGVNGVSFDIVLCLFRAFFSSPYPVSMALSLECPHFNPIPDSLPVNQDESANKSLKLVFSHFSPHLSSLLPRILVLKLLSFEDCHEDTLSVFASLESISLKKFSLKMGYSITQDNMSTIALLFRVVDAKEWDLSVELDDDDDTVDMFACLLSKTAHRLCHFRLQNERFSIRNTVSIIEAIFLSLSPTGFSCFELSLDSSVLGDGIAEALHESWMRCGAVKLKRINVFHELSVMDTLLDMASEVIPYVDEFMV